MSDSHYYFLSSLLQMDGTNGSTSFPDQSFRTKTWTAAGNAQLTTTGPKFGTAAGTFDGTGDYLSTGSHADFGFGTGPFTVEGWHYPTFHTNNRCLFDNRGASATGIAIMSQVASPATSVGRLCAISNTGQIAGDNTAAFTLNTWQHWAVTRDENNVLRGFINGVQVWSVVDSRTYASASTAYIGAYYDGTQGYIGKMDSVRVTKGYARYTADFTPPDEAFDGTVPDVNTGTLDLTLDDFAGFGGGAGFADIAYAIQSDAYGAGIGDAAVGNFIGAGQAGAYSDNQLADFIGAATGGPVNNGADLRLLAFTSLAYGAGSGSAALGAFAVSAAGTVTNVGHAQQQIDPFTAQASGTVTMQGSGSVSLGRFTSEGYGGGLMSGDIGQFDAYGAGTAGTVGRSTDQRLGNFIGFATGIQENYGGADLVIGAFVNGPYAHGDATLAPFVAFGQGGPVVVITYEAYAINLKPGENMPHQMTRYTNWPFNQFIRHGNTWYGVAADGLYPIGGTTDYADPPTKVNWRWHTASTDFGTRQKKQVRETFLHGRLSGSVAASVSVGEDADVSYPAVIVRGAGGQAHRIKYGKGLKGEFWSFGLSGNGAGDIDSMQHEPAELGRKL